ncbi:MAG TPA: sulfatase-like hydrolase/transferase, partial [Chloroflexota bacterium]|nr:sulfatase-like hydrolase/transferase [Chloroflexota bacterium]
VRFTRAFCPTAHCCPSRASLMTGLYPSQHGIHNNVSNPARLSGALKPGTPMFSDSLNEAGYRLIYTGKWHVSDEENPSDRGWEEMAVTAAKGSFMHRSPEQWRTLPLTSFDGQPRPEGVVRRPGWGDFQLYRTVPAQGPLGFEGDKDWKVIRAGLDALDMLTQGDQPWCLYVGPIGPHDPYVVPEPFVQRYSLGDVPLPPNFGDTLEDKPRVYQRMRRQYWGQLTEDEYRDAVRHYWAYTTMEDAMFGLIMEVLQASGQLEDTLVIRLSDHGDYVGAHGLFMKGVPAFREGYNIPCVLSWPAAMTGAGRTEDAFVTLADIAPTILDAAGVPIPEGLTGRSLLPFLRGETPDDWPDAFYSQLNGVELYYTQRVVQTDDFKYVYNGFDFDELYDLRNDPHEMTNLAEDPAYAEAKQELVRKMWRLAADTGDYIFNPYPTVALAPWGPADALRP